MAHQPPPATDARIPLERQINGVKKHLFYDRAFSQRVIERFALLPLDFYLQGDEADLQRFAQVTNPRPNGAIERLRQRNSHIPASCLAVAAWHLELILRVIEREGAPNPTFENLVHQLLIALARPFALIDDELPPKAGRALQQQPGNLSLHEIAQDLDPLRLNERTLRRIGAAGHIHALFRMAMMRATELFPAAITLIDLDDRGELAAGAPLIALRACLKDPYLQGTLPEAVSAALYQPQGVDFGALRTLLVTPFAVLYECGALERAIGRGEGQGHRARTVLEKQLDAARSERLASTPSR